MKNITVTLLLNILFLSVSASAQKSKEKLSVNEKAEKLTTTLSHHIALREDQVAKVKEVNLFIIQGYQEIKKDKRKDPSSELKRLKQEASFKMKEILDESQYKQYEDFIESWIVSKADNIEKREKGQTVKKHYGKRSRQIHTEED